MKKEQEILDQLVEEAVNSAKSQGLNRFTKADTKAYLMEREIDILRNTEDLFYTKVNQELRKKPN